MNEDTIKEIINDARDLASVSDDMTRIGLDGIANRLEKLVADGATPPTGEGEKKRNWLELPRGVRLMRYCGADRCVTYVGQYRATDPGELGASDSRPLRIYVITLNQRDDTAWDAVVNENDAELLTIQTNCGGRCMAEYVAVKALAAWLHYQLHQKGKPSAKRHRKALKKRKKAARRAAREAEEKADA